MKELNNPHLYKDRDIPAKYTKSAGNTHKHYVLRVPGVLCLCRAGLFDRPMMSG